MEGKEVSNLLCVIQHKIHSKFYTIKDNDMPIGSEAYFTNQIETIKMNCIRYACTCYYSDAITENHVFVSPFFITLCKSYYVLHNPKPFYKIID